MPNLRLDLAYDGSGFRGYARQEGWRTVQGELDEALETVIGAPVDTAVAGRTDAGVHARGQVVSVRVPEGVDPDGLARSLNGILGPEIAVHAATVVDEGFHARFSARWRLYRYSISVAFAPDPLTRRHVWHVGRPLDVGSMSATARFFLGEHDFASFCRAVPGAGTVRRVDAARWEEGGEGSLDFWIEANAFCHQMVRSLVGLSYDVGRGFTPLEAVPEIIDAKDRSRVATVAPPHGLVLWQVGY